MCEAQHDPTLLFCHMNLHISSSNHLGPTHTLLPKTEIRKSLFLWLFYYYSVILLCQSKMASKHFCQVSHTVIPTFTKNAQVSAQGVIEECSLSYNCCRFLWCFECLEQVVDKLTQRYFCWFRRVCVVPPLLFCWTLLASVKVLAVATCEQLPLQKYRW